MEIFKSVISLWGIGLRSHWPTLNEQHRTVKELLEQLKMKKSSAKQQEVERVKPQREKVHQTLILGPAAPEEEAAAADAANELFLVMLILDHLHLLRMINVACESRNRCLGNHRTTASSRQSGQRKATAFMSSWLRSECMSGL